MINVNKIRLFEQTMRLYHYNIFIKLSNVILSKRQTDRSNKDNR